mmetsp:Transcript_36066/g.81036  ORF Transcript_36066/g.81036 Transcript_36066/m.81036 type:complete len:261 (+) Transcript_36066:456-1238(+)
MFTLTHMTCSNTSMTLRSKSNAAKVTCYIGLYYTTPNLDRQGFVSHDCTLSDILNQLHSGGFINVHAGVDAWCLDESIDFLQRASTIIDVCKYNVVIETHRQRLFHSPFTTRELLSHPKVKELANIKLNADLSHWFVSCERIFDPSTKRDRGWWPSLLGDLLAPRCEYIHCRFGFAQGPQMADPSIKECEQDVYLQLRNWVVLWKSQIDRGDDECWCCPEYGPKPYMPSLPNGEDVASLTRAVKCTKEAIQDVFDGEFNG